jgi:lysophospholipid acyltransferase (LPLAT)-like uncharacterized protein
MSTAKEIKYFLINTLLSSLIYHVLNLYTKTLRVRYEGSGKVLKHLENGGKMIVPSWHQRFFIGFFLPKIFKLSPCIMISKSRDGDFISKVVQRIGWIPARGSSSRGGKDALRAMVKGVNENKIGGHIVDGPTGPPCIIKPGLISLARSTDAVICPIFVAYEKAWTAKSWDRFMVPKPFSRVLLRFGAILPVPKISSDDQFESFRRQVEEYMIRECEVIDGYWKK